MTQHRERVVSLPRTIGITRVMSIIMMLSSHETVPLSLRRRFLKRDSAGRAPRQAAARESRPGEAREPRLAPAGRRAPLRRSRLGSQLNFRGRAGERAAACAVGCSDLGCDSLLIHSCLYVVCMRGGWVGVGKGGSGGFRAGFRRRARARGAARAGQGPGRRHRRPPR